MKDIPRHPETQEGCAVGDVRPASRPRWVYALVALGIALLVLMVVLHLTGVVGPGGH
jgi:hypothetical protein